MTPDPLEQLKIVDESVEPRPAFAAKLYERIAMSLDTMLASVSEGETEGYMQTITHGVPYTRPGVAIRWLTGIFGMNVLKFWGPAEDPMFAYLSWGNTYISVYVRPPDDNAWSKVGPASMDLLADEETIRSAYERALAAGAEVVRELQEQRNPAVPEGYLGFSLRDHEGNLWSMQSRQPSFDVS